MRAISGAEGSWLRSSWTSSSRSPTRRHHDAPSAQPRAQLCMRSSAVPPAISWGASKQQRSPLRPIPTQQQLLPAAAQARQLPKLLPPPESKQLLVETWKMLKASFWPIMLIFAAKDTIAFVLHRLGHRLTNLVAEAALGIPLSSMINPWWLLLDSKFLESNMGYQAVIALIFLLCLPLNILLNSYAMSATMYVVKAEADAAAATAAAAAADADADATAAAPASADVAVDPSSSTKLGAEGQVTSPVISTLATPSSSSSSAAAAAADQGGEGAGAFSRTLATYSAASTSVSADSSSSSSSSSSSEPASPSSSEAGPLLQPGTGLIQPDTGAAAADGAPAPTPSWMERAASLLGLSSSAAASSSQEPAGSQAGDGSSAPPEASTSPAAAASAVPPPPSGGVVKSLRLAWAEVWAVMPEVNKGLKRVWWVDLLFNLQALPLQALSLLVVPLFWTLPRLLDIQLAVPIAITERLEGKAALERSAQVMSGFKRAYAWPFAALLVLIRLLDMVRTLLLTLVPPRWWQEVIELPLLLILLFGFAKIVVIRLQDILPAATYVQLSSASSERDVATPLVAQAEPISPSVPSM